MAPFEAVKAKYAALWAHAEILPARLPSITNAAKLVLSNKTRYKVVQAKLGVPWMLVGLLHLREADCSFHGHLHNGDSLLQRTHNVPAGRPPPPLYPPFTWEDSAADALRMRGLENVKDWSIERLAYEAEGYNGWGYASRNRPSPYDWSGDTLDGHHELATGKYIRDHVFDPSVIDSQPGVMSAFKVLLQLDPTIHTEFPWINSSSPSSAPLRLPDGSGQPSLPASPPHSPSGPSSASTSTPQPKPLLALPPPVSQSVSGTTSPTLSQTAPQLPSPPSDTEKKVTS